MKYAYEGNAKEMMDLDFLKISLDFESCPAQDTSSDQVRTAYQEEYFPQT